MNKSFYQYRKSLWDDKTVVTSSYIHNAISYIGIGYRLYIESAPGIMLHSFL